MSAREEQTIDLEVLDSSTQRHDNSLEQELCRAASNGDIEEIRRIVNSRDPPVDVNCIDDNQRTPLELLVENSNQNEDLFQFLIENGAETEAAILSAVKQKNIPMLKILLECRSGLVNNSLQKCVSNPLMLATKVGDCEMVQLLMEHRENVAEYDQKCKCSSCLKTNIPPAIDRLKRFLTLASPLYLSAQYMLQKRTIADPTTDMENVATSPGVYQGCLVVGNTLFSSLGGDDVFKGDPIYNALELRAKLKERASLDYELKENYLALCDGLDNFLLDLLNECSDIEEVKTVMNTDYGEHNNTSSISDEANRFSILHFAIENENAKFIAHPHCQMMLNQEIYDKLPKLKKKSWIYKYFLAFLLTLIFPVWTFCYLFMPSSYITKQLKKPLVRYMTFIGSYFVFLLLVTATAFQPETDFLKFSIVDWVVAVYIIGYLVEIVVELCYVGRRRYFCNWHNYIFVLMVTAFLVYYIVWVVGYIGVKIYCKHHACVLPLHREAWYDVVLSSYSFYSIGILLSFTYILSTIQFHSKLGTLLMTLLKVLKDVVYFFGFFVVLFIAFVVSTKKLYLQYVQSSDTFFQSSKVARFSNQTSNVTKLEHHLSSIKGSLETVFWSLFGMVDLNHFETDDRYFVVKVTGLLLFALYNILAVLVALNILIAMLDDSYAQKASEADITWKYSRAKMLLTIINRKSVLPSPLNLINFHGYVEVFRCIMGQTCCKCCTGRGRPERHSSVERQKLITRLVEQYITSKETGEDSKKVNQEHEVLAGFLDPYVSYMRELKKKRGKQSQSTGRGRPERHSSVEDRSSVARSKTL